MSEEPHWRVRYRRRSSAWEYVLDFPRQRDFLTPPPPREFGVRYKASMEAAAAFMHGADMVEIERHPPLETETAIPGTNGAEPETTPTETEDASNPA